MIDKIINRSAAEQIRHALTQPYIIALLGPRQVGKTTLLKELIPSKKSLFITFDSGEIRDKILSREIWLQEQIEEENRGPLIDTKNPFYLCIDEAQKLPESFEIIKQLYDQHKGRLKIILSGSSSLLIKKHSVETLSGRIRFFHLHPFSLEEACRFSGLKKDIQNTETLEWVQKLLEGKMTEKEGKINIEKKRYIKSSFHKKLEEWCLWGLMPGRLHFENEEEWILLLRDYVDTYIEKDMRSIERIGSLGDYKKLVRLMGHQLGSLVNYSTTAKTLEIHRQTVKEYLQILDESLLGFRLPAYSESVMRQVAKSEKSFLIDNGLAYYFSDLKSYEVMEASGRIGNFYENLFISEFKKYGDLLKIPLYLCYWRLSGANPPEVDLVTNYRGTTIPMEIKKKRKIDHGDLRGLRAFFSSVKKSLSVPYGVLIYQGDFEYRKDENIFLVPDWFFT